MTFMPGGKSGPSKKEARLKAAEAENFLDCALNNFTSSVCKGVREIGMQTQMVKQRLTH